MKLKAINYVFALIIFTSTSLHAQETIIATRLESNPIIKPSMLSEKDGQNINGPSLIKVPKWIKEPLGKYYLYFAHHEGKYIRLAYADNIEGPWKIYEKGTLKMEECICNNKSEKLPDGGHIASPDVLIDSKNKELVMYFHCPVYQDGLDILKDYPQLTFRATSKNGITFNPEKEILGNNYFRVFKWNNQFYAIARLGLFYKSKDGITNFEKGPNSFNKIQNPSTVRHSAVFIRKNNLYVFYSRIGDVPERILVSKIRLTNDWNNWIPSEPTTVLEPLLGYEGINEPLKKSVAGASYTPVRELRDPAIFKDNRKIYLLYSISGELGIAIAELKFEKY